jgi:hypothetical protein
MQRAGLVVDCYVRAQGRLVIYLEALTPSEAEGFMRNTRPSPGEVVAMHERYPHEPNYRQLREEEAP